MLVTKRRRVYLLAAGSTLGMAVAVACSFPDPELVPDETTEAGADGTADGHATDADAGARPDAIVEPDSPPPIDATSEKPALDANCDPCDCDDDGYATKDAAACADAGSKPRTDCDDQDPRANPDAGFVKARPTDDTLGDWNCDSKVNRELGVNINCADYSGLLSSCAKVEGFTGDPACGESKTYVFCKVSGLSCVQDTAKTETRTQGCK